MKTRAGGRAVDRSIIGAAAASPAAPLATHMIENIVVKVFFIITWTINRRNAIGHTPKIAESINLDIDPLSLILTRL